MVKNVVHICKNIIKTHYKSLSHYKNNAVSTHKKHNYIRSSVMKNVASNQKNHYQMIL